MNIRTPQSGNAARIAKSFLKSIGQEVSHSQALELIARMHGYTDNQAMQADDKFVDPLALRADANNEFTFVGPKNTAVWITVGNISVYVKKTDEGVVVDLFPASSEMNESIGSTYAFYDDAAPSCKKCGGELDTGGYCIDETCPHQDWPQAVNVKDLDSMSTEEVEAKYSVKKRVPLSEKAPETPEPGTSHGHNLVLVYGDLLENYATEEAARDAAQAALPDLPDQAFWEDADCEETFEVFVWVESGTVHLKTDTPSKD